jgi:DnaJ-class molecular chaperone
MTTLQEWLEDIEHQLEGVEAFSVGGSDRCEDCNEHGEEEEFTNRDCESCGTGLAGGRHAAHGIIDGTVYHFMVCPDCLFFHANGDIPERLESDD